MVDNLDCDERAFGLFKDESPSNTELLSFTSLGPKNYVCDFGIVTIDDENNFTFKVTETLARCKGLTLHRQNVQNMLSKNLMREFLKALAEDKKMQLAVPQYQFKIQAKTFEITPREFKKILSNKKLFLKRIYDPKRSLTKTWPIGATSYYPD